MSTHSLIGVVKKIHVEAIYCHFDGYVQGGVGETLNKYYSSNRLADTILELGDHSSLGITPEESEVYARDWKEHKSIPYRYLSAEDFRKKGNEYFKYLWDGQQWLASIDKSQWLTIPKALTKERKLNQE